MTDLQLFAVSHRSRYTKEQAMDSKLYPTSACQLIKILLKTVTGIGLQYMKMTSCDCAVKYCKGCETALVQNKTFHVHLYLLSWNRSSKSTYHQVKTESES